MEPRIDLSNFKWPDPEELEQRLLKESFRGELDTVRVGDLIIEPWKLSSLRLESPDSSVLRVPEVTNPEERQALAEEALTAAQDIMWVYHSLYKQPRIFQRRLAGLCMEGSALVQELLARVGVRTLLVFGQYHAYKTDRYFAAAELWRSPFVEPPSRASREGLFGHWWLFESLTEALPSSVQAAQDELLIVDPTRGQFDEKRPMLAHLGDQKYRPDAPGRSVRDPQYEWNHWLWNDTELLAWRRLIKEIHPTK